MQMPCPWKGKLTFSIRPSFCLLALANMGTVHQLLEKKCSKIIRLPDTCKPIFYARLAIYVAEQGHNSRLTFGTAKKSYMCWCI